MPDGATALERISPSTLRGRSLWPRTPARPPRARRCGSRGPEISAPKRSSTCSRSSCSGGPLGQPGCLELRQAGRVGAQFGLALERGFPQALFECPGLGFPALVLGREALLCSRRSSLGLLRVARPAAPCCPPPSEPGWPRSYLSADSFASASLLACGLSQLAFAPLSRALTSPQLLLAPFLELRGPFELLAQRLDLRLLTPRPRPGILSGAPTPVSAAVLLRVERPPVWRSSERFAPRPASFRSLPSRERSRVPSLSAASLRADSSSAAWRASCSW